MIVESNSQSGLSPSSEEIPRRFFQEGDKSQLPFDANPRPLSVPDKPISFTEGQDELFLSPPPKHSSHQPSDFTRSLVSDHRRLQGSLASPKYRPDIHPKPEGLRAQSKGLSNNIRAGAETGLEQRFSQLRAQSGTESMQADREIRRFSNGSQYGVSPPPYSPYPPNGLYAQEYQTVSKQGSVPSSINLSAPGTMSPPPPPPYPPPPPKIPLDHRPEVLPPRAPSPTYDPAKSISASSNSLSHSNKEISRPKVVARPSSSGWDSSSPTAGLTNLSRLSMANNTQNEINSATNHFLDLPNTTFIRANELYDRLRVFNLLLIDVRSREEFDRGHIFAKSTMCIEPLELRSGVSAEELEERLVISPAAELSLFEKRNEFDLIVYYDQNTASDEFLKGAPNTTIAPALRALYDTLYEFNAYKPLRHPPALLLGGLDAWVELFGPHSLQTSHTAALIGSIQSRNRSVTPRPGRPIGRVPMASSNSSLEIRKRRLRLYQPLDADEEKIWRETARKEEVVVSEYRGSQSDSDADSSHSNSAEPRSPFAHTYEDFLRKFPEPSAIKESMISAQPSLAPYPPPLPPPPPIRHLPSLPSVPSRPPPTLPRPSYGGVLERESLPLSPTSRQPLSKQPPLYTSRAVSHFVKLPRTGLLNFGVTCYMNATIQCLLATLPLSQFFLDTRWRDHTQDNWKGSRGIMPGIYANLIRSLWRNDVPAIRPVSLRKFCARLNREWGEDRQQDAKEYLDFLLDCLHEDLNINWRRTPLQPLGAREEMIREAMPVRDVSKIEWERYLHRDSSFISSLFAGQHASRLRCKTCRKTSTTYEAFYSVSVEIPRSGHSDIHTCLRSYCQEEMLSGDEVWRCPHCRCEREATKQIIITRAPQFLVIHLKRFSASKTESARKVHTPIDFPLYGLNMEPYMLQKPSDMSQGSTEMDDDADLAITSPYIYDAYAVMRHIGQSGNGGHYVSLVRDMARGCWRKFDDEKVSDFEPNKLRPSQRLQNEQAYLVFYGRAAAR